MKQRSLSRRSLLGAGVAAGAAAATAAGHGALASAAAPAAGPTRVGRASLIGGITRPEVLSPVSAGEQVLFVAAAGLTPNGTGATTSMGFERGYFPSGGDPRFLSASINVPLGSTLTNIEFVINGTPQSGRVALRRLIPDGSAAPTDIAGMDIPAATNGRTVYSLAIPTPAGAAEIYDGTQTYEAYYRQTGVASNCVIEGVRVRFLPPGNALVPVPPVRVYDSRLNMAPDANGTLSSGANRTVSVANGRNVTTGAVTGVAVPANATAIAYTLTVTETFAQGFLAVNPGGNTTVSASTINWQDTGLDLANTGVVKIAPNRTVTVIAGGGGTTHFVIDVVGYYL